MVPDNGETVLQDVYSNDSPLMWVFGILLTVSAIPALILIPPKVTHDRTPVVVTLALFGLVGLLFLWGAMSGTIRQRKFSPITCHLDRPIHPGGQIHGEIRARMPVLPRDGFVFDVSCWHQSGTGRHSTTGERWTTRQTISAAGMAPNAGNIRIPFAIEIPPAAELTDDTSEYERTYWTMNVSADVDGIDFRAQFPLRVTQSVD